MGILEMDFERILGVPFFHSSSDSIMLWNTYVLGVDLGPLSEILAVKRRRVTTTTNSARSKPKNASINCFI